MNTHLDPSLYKMRKTIILLVVFSVTIMLNLILNVKYGNPSPSFFVNQAADMIKIENSSQSDTFMPSPVPTPPAVQRQSSKFPATPSAASAAAVWPSADQLAEPTPAADH
jgi:hypothetical protein